MTQPTKLNERESYTCREYLERKLNLSPNWLSEDTDIQLNAEKMFEKAKRDKVTLSEWIISNCPET